MPKKTSAASGSTMNAEGHHKSNRPAHGRPAAGAAAQPQSILRHPSRRGTSSSCVPGWLRLAQARAPSGRSAAPPVPARRRPWLSLHPDRGEQANARSAGPRRVCPTGAAAGHVPHVLAGDQFDEHQAERDGSEDVAQQDHACLYQQLHALTSVSRVARNTPYIDSCYGMSVDGRGLLPRRACPRSNSRWLPMALWPATKVLESTG